jgi:hypothetical protein
MDDWMGIAEKEANRNILFPWWKGDPRASSDKDSVGKKGTKS